MPGLAQICMVFATLALIGIAIVAIRVLLEMRTMLVTANRSLAELPKLIDRATRTSERADELLAAFSRITRSASAGAAQVEGLATRTTIIASRLLDEVEAPLIRTVGVLRGLRTGWSHLTGLWNLRAAGRSNGPPSADSSSDARWLDDGGAHSRARVDGEASGARAR